MSSLKGMSPDMRKVVERAIQQGYLIKTGKKHMKLIPPDKTQDIITVGISISDHRAHKNLKARLRRQGVLV